MLQNLHVKNLALIDETEVEFGPGPENLLSSDQSILLWEKKSKKKCYVITEKPLWWN